jgi:hypothetical protein
MKGTEMSRVQVEGCPGFAKGQLRRGKRWKDGRNGVNREFGGRISECGIKRISDIQYRTGHFEETDNRNEII